MPAIRHPMESLESSLHPHPSGGGDQVSIFLCCHYPNGKVGKVFHVPLGGAQVIGNPVCFIRRGGSSKSGPPSLTDCSGNK